MSIFKAIINYDITSYSFHMDKSKLSERDICTKFITPAIEGAGWDRMTQYREEVNFTGGKIHVRGKLATRGVRKRADYIFYYKPNIPIAIIEVKENNHSLGHGMQQALNYADILNIPFIFSTNGDGFLFYDKTNPTALETEIALDDFPSPEELWQKYLVFKRLSNPTAQQIVEKDYHFDGKERNLISLTHNLILPT